MEQQCKAIELQSSSFGEKNPSQMDPTLILLLGSIKPIRLKACKTTSVISWLIFLHLEHITSSMTQSFEGSFGQLRLAVVTHLLPSFMSSPHCQQAEGEDGAQNK